MESKPHILYPFSFQKEIKPGFCEDAPPVATDRYAIVCDGLGGAGHTKHLLPDEENPGTVTERTSAYLGSRIVADRVERFFAEHWEEWAGPEQTPEIGVYAGQLKEELDRAIQDCVEKMRIRIPVGKTIKIFPTTLASAVFLPCEDGLRVAAIWAGDSRVYLLTPSKGLRLLSLDDADGAAESMNSGTVMTNCVYAGSFFLNYCVYTLREPGLVFCCSDGCFDYLRSPLHLEWLLLHTIQNMPQEDGRQPGEILGESIRDGIYQTIRDDTTMAGLCVGLSSIVSLQEAFRTRTEDLDPMAVQMNGYIMEKNAALDALDKARRVCRLNESKVSDGIQRVVETTLSSRTPRDLYEALKGFGAFSEYEAWEAEGLERLETEFRERENRIERDLKERNRLCRSQFLIDYMVWQNRPIRRNWVPIAWLGLEEEAALDARTFDEMLSTLMELFKLEEFWEGFPEFDCKIQQNLRFLLGKLRDRLDQDGDQYRPLLSRAYLSTDLFDGQRKELEKDSQFQSAYRKLLSNPGACSFCGAKTREAAKSVRALKEEKETLRERYQQDRQAWQEKRAAQYCEKQKGQILEELLEKPPRELETLLGGTSLPMAAVLSLAEAWKALRQNEKANPAEAVEVKIQGLWSEYRKEYQLFQQVERGRT